MVRTKILWKIGLATALAGGFLLLGGAATARAEDYNSCRRNVEKWEYRLDRDTNRHGYYSRQANHDRPELAETRENCERRYGYDWRDHDDYYQGRDWR